MLKGLVVSFVLVSLFAACSGGSDVADDGSSQGVLAATNGLGTTCDSNRDCPANLACHVDHDKHVADGQCVTFCVSNADCAKLGPRAKCIGAGICVATCAADVDCPSGTRCAEEGFCERTGSGSGEPYCSGTATPCGMLSHAECTLQAGCGDGLGMACGAASWDCDAFSDQESCIIQKGCTWDSAGKACGGTAVPCSSLVAGADCSQQRGCLWTPNCTGEPAESDCSKISATLCQFTHGCELVSE